MTSAKLSVVGQLYRSGALAAREGVKMASLTRLVAELENEGWAGRETGGLSAMSPAQLFQAAWPGWTVSWPAAAATAPEMAETPESTERTKMTGFEETC